MLWHGRAVGLAARRNDECGQQGDAYQSKHGRHFAPTNRNVERVNSKAVKNEPRKTLKTQMLHRKLSGSLFVSRWPQKRRGAAFPAAVQATLAQKQYIRSDCNSAMAQASVPFRNQLCLCAWPDLPLDLCRVCRRRNILNRDARSKVRSRCCPATWRSFP